MNQYTFSSLGFSFETLQLTACSGHELKSEVYADYSDCTSGYGKIGRSVVSDVRSTACGVRHLALPNSVFAPKNDAAVRAPWPAAASEADLAAREEAHANTAHI